MRFSTSLAILGFAALTLSATPAAFAEQKAVIAKCTGTGATFYLSDATPSEATVISGIDQVPQGDAVLVLKAGEKPFWSNKSRKQIDIDCGGEGKDVIELFPGLQPKDGVWKTEVSETKMLGCPDMIAQGFAKQAPQAQTMTRSVVFPKPFDPNKLPRDFNPGHTWYEAGENRWSTRLFDQKVDYGQQGQQSVGVDMTMELVSATEISQSGTVKIDLPDIAKQMLGDTSNCRVQTTSVSRWISD